MKPAKSLIEDVMIEKFNVIKKGSPLSEAYKLIKSTNIDTTIIIDKKNRPIGIITIWNLIRAKTLCLPFDKTPVEEVMSFPVVTIKKDEDIEEAARMMLINRIKNVVVVDESGKLVGLITAKVILECESCFINVKDFCEVGTLYKIAIIGGTGKQGKGLALRWAKAGHTILIGSRNKEHAKVISNEIINNLKAIGINAKVKYGINSEVVKGADIVVFTVPYSSLDDLIMDIKDSLSEGQIILSPVVPIEVNENGEIGVGRHRISAAEKIALMTKVLGVKTIAAFHTIPATNLSKVEFPLNFDVVVCGDDKEAKNTVMSLVSQISNLRPLDGGSLRNAVTLEYLTSLAINIGRTYKKTTIGLKFL
ncbi:MAG: NADPH-dependent F420 reductase [Candidatus Odinarchaeia archaeon]